MSEDPIYSRNNGGLLKTIKAFCLCLHTTVESLCKEEQS